MYEDLSFKQPKGTLYQQQQQHHRPEILLVKRNFNLTPVLRSERPLIKDYSLTLNDCL